MADIHRNSPRSHRKYNPDQELFITEAYKSGVSARTIADAFQCDTATIGNILRRYGVPLRSRNHRSKTTSPLIIPEGFNCSPQRSFLHRSPSIIAEEKRLAASRPKRKRPVKITSEIVSAVIEGYRQTGSCAGAGKAAGCGTITAYKILKREGVKLKNLGDQNAGRSRWNEEDKKDMVRRYVAGEKMKDICAAHKISRPQLKHIITVSGVAKRSSSTYNRIYTVDHHYFSNIEREDQAWVIGFIATDGCIYNGKLTLTLQRRDESTVAHINELLGGTYKIYRAMQKLKEKRFSASSLTIPSKQITSDLARIGITPRKSKTIQFWSDCPAHLMRHYVRGMIDGDGSIFRGKTKWHELWQICYLGTQSMSEGIANFIRKAINIEPGSITFDPDRGTYLRYTRQKDVQAICRLLYTDCEHYLPRKKEKADLVISSTFREYFNWSNIGLEQLAKDYAELGSWQSVAEKYGTTLSRVSNRISRLRRLARGIKC